MDQLTIGDILTLVKKLKDSKMSWDEIRSLPIYLGDDDELNGIHCGWALDIVDINDTDEDNVYLVEMINGDRNNIKLDGKAVVIS